MIKFDLESKICYTICMKNYMIDVHAHLTDLDEVEKVILNSNQNGVKKIITAGYDLSSSRKCVEIASQYENVFAVVGVHPENVDALEGDYLSALQDLAKNDKVVGIGEIGLDYHYTKENKDKQAQVLIAQIELANKLNLPIVVHSRDAMSDTLEILKSHMPSAGGLMHCYSGSVESAKELLKLNFSFSFGGVCTFKNAKNVCEVIASLPCERIMLETDCPYMAPVPHRGERNEPKFLPHILEKIAEIKGVSFEDMATKTTQNAERLFKI